MLRRSCANRSLPVSRRVRTCTSIRRVRPSRCRRRGIGGRFQVWVRVQPARRSCECSFRRCVALAPTGGIARSRRSPRPLARAVRNRDSRIVSWRHDSDASLRSLNRCDCDGDSTNDSRDGRSPPPQPQQRQAVTRECSEAAHVITPAQHASRATLSPCR